jgi:hypothetical protein
MVDAMSRPLMTGHAAPSRMMERVLRTTFKTPDSGSELSTYHISAKSGIGQADQQRTRIGSSVALEIHRFLTNTHGQWNEVDVVPLGDFH